MSVKEVLAGTRPWWIEPGDCLNSLRAMPVGCVHVCVTSPPYYSLRDYQTGSWEGGNPACDHKASNGQQLAQSTASTRGGSHSTAETGPRPFLEICERCGARRVDEQIGLEASPEKYVAKLVEVFREVRRVLHDTGTLWLNIGDTYAQNGKYGGQSGCKNQHSNNARMPRTPRGDAGETGLLGIPWKLAFALQADGWILRSESLWIKNNSMPESLSGWRWAQHRVKVSGGQRGKEARKGAMVGARPQQDHGSGSDHAKFAPWAKWEPCPGCEKCSPNGGLVLRRGSWRPSRSHEHVFIFAKSRQYFADGEDVRTRLAEATVSRDRYTRVLDDADEQFAVRHDHETEGSPAGANLRTCWTLRPEQLRATICKACKAYYPAGAPKKGGKTRPCRCGSTDFLSHYAAFPSDLPRIAIQAGTSAAGCCPACLAPWARVLEPRLVPTVKAAKTCVRDSRDDGGAAAGDQGSRRQRDGHVPGWARADETLGWRPTCSCEAAEPVPCLVIDPFSGAGTSMLQAVRLGRRAIGLELNGDYVILSNARITEDNPLFNRT